MDDLSTAFAAAQKGRAEALIVLASAFFAAHRVALVELAAKYRLPAMYTERGFVDAGGLMSYGPNLAGSLPTCRHLCGQDPEGRASPPTCPVEQPTKFELIINLPDRQGPRTHGSALGAGAGGRSHRVTYTAYSVSWNFTQRCNLECAHCYMSAFAGAETRGELSTAECRRVIDEIAQVNPERLLDPHRRRAAAPEGHLGIAGYAAEKRFTTVLGTNGVLLREPEAGGCGARRARAPRSASTPPIPAVTTPSATCRAPGTGAVRATRGLTDAGLDFSLHMSVTDWNVGEVPAMIDLARELGAKVLNFFFLVRTGRGETSLTSTPRAYERILTYLARVQGVGRRPGLRAGARNGRPDPDVRGSVVDAGGARRWAPHPRQVRAALPPHSLRDEPALAAAPELRARLVPRREVLLSDHAEGGRHAVPLHAGRGR